jgi:hypothetical protein
MMSTKMMAAQDIFIREFAMQTQVAVQPQSNPGSSNFGGPGASCDLLWFQNLTFPTWTDQLIGRVGLSIRCNGVISHNLLLNA